MPKETGKPSALETRMPRRKRIDPADAPIDGGEANKDVVHGKDPGKHYAYIHAEDLGVARSRGMLQSDRESGVKSDHDIHSEGPIQVGDLVLMEMSAERKAAIDKAQVAEFARRQGNERRNVQDYARNNPGSEYKEQRVSA